MMPPRCTAALLKLVHDEISLVGRKRAPSYTVLSLSFWVFLKSEKRYQSQNGSSHIFLFQIS